MKLYTKTGDKGKTGLFGGQRVSKHHARLDAYGTIDELNSHLGIIAGQLTAADVAAPLVDDVHRVQHYLFTIGSHLATPYNPDESTPESLPPLLERELLWLEKTIDAYTADTPELRQFILPGGNAAAAQAHVARAVCRRAERLVVVLQEDESIDPHCVQYINRLSDMLFALARYINAKTATTEISWKPLHN